MRYRSIPRTDIKVSEIGFGCWTMGGPNFSPQNGQPIGWGEINVADVRAGIKAGLDGGVNHWDNADVYGNGRAERLLGQILKDVGVKRDTQIIATKVGHARGASVYPYDPFHIRHQCEQSLRNLRVDHIDIYYFHHGTFIGPDYDGKQHDYLHEAAATMHALTKEGKVRAIGQSAYSDDDFERVVPVVKPHVLQNKANLRYDPFIKVGCRLQALMQKHDCAFVGFGPLDQGILLDKFDPDKPVQFEEGDYRANRKDFNPDTLREIRKKLAKVRDRYHVDGVADVEILSSIASRWVLSHERVLSVIPGFRNERQAKCNLRAAVDGAMGAEDAGWLRTLFGA
jgi:myo-inositol catabolism protein IolS